MSKFDLSKFKKVRSGEKHTVLKHPEGHEITIFHSKLSKPIRSQLDKLPMHMSDGGDVVQKNGKKVVNAIRTSVGGNPLPEPAPTLDVDYTSQEQAKRKATRESFGYAEGGQVAPIDPDKAKQVSDSFKKALGFANGGTIQGDETPVMASRLESQYGAEDQAAQGDAQGQIDADQIGRDIPNVDPNAPITPPAQDASHAHLAEAVKNLSQKFVGAPQVDTASVADSIPIGNQPPIPAAAQVSDQGQPQGTLPEQAQADINQEARVNTAIGKNTQSSLSQQADIHGQNAQNMQKVYEEYQEYGHKFHEMFDNLSKQVATGEVDPSRWWNSKSTGSKILTAIGMLFSGAGMGASGHPELAQEAISSAINHDIDAQKANLQNKQTLLGKYMDMYNSLPQAEAAARLTMSAAAEGLINQQAAKLGSNNALLIQQAANAKMRREALPHMEGLAKGQVMGQMYNEMNKPSTPSSSAEQGYTNQMAKMRILNPDLGKDMENKYLPNVGIARVPVPDKLREELTTRRDLSDKLAQLENFAKEHEGTIRDRAVVNQGKAMAAQVQDAYRTAHQQGVFKESESKFINSILSGDPTSFFAGIRTLPGYRQARQFNDDTVKQFYKSYGIKPFSGGNEPQSGNQAAVEWLKANPKDPRAEAVRRKLGM